MWDANIPILQLYWTVRRYFTPIFAGMGELIDYKMDSAVIIELAKAKDVNVADALELLPDLHSGYLSKVLKQVKKEKEDGG